VQTGLDLVEFPTIAWYETEVSVLQSTPNAALLVGRDLIGCQLTATSNHGARRATGRQS